MTTKSQLTRSRIVESAVHVFANSGKESASLVEIAKEAQITSQGIYRYFSNKDELYLEAIRADVEDLFFQLLRRLAPIPAPFFAGAVWLILIELLPSHPLAIEAVLSKESAIQAVVKSCISTQLLQESFIAEMKLASEKGIVRQDIDASVLAKACADCLIEISIPTIMEGKYGTPEWISLQMIFLSAAFYPLPDFLNEEVIVQFQEQARELGLNAVLNNYNFD
ncbi:DNA-binding transcriptional repressor AcrR [Aurantimicrobium sp. MWH-Uga1]|nr:DNA-binding transcriptional repressor AcrR [Aurantimicrobium sp. MWH-Uga1]